MKSLLRNISMFLLLLTACASALSAVTWTLPTRVPIAGEWNSANPGAEIGYYNTESSTFFLCTQRAAVGQLPCTAYETPITKAGRMPLMGRWSRLDSIDRPGLYDPSTGQLLLFRYLSCLPGQCSSPNGYLALDQIYSLGIVGAKATSGDWSGDGIDTLALVILNPKRQVLVGTPVGDVLFYAADHRSTDSVLALDFNPTAYQVIAGRWPGNSTATDYLGFFESTSRSVLLETDLAQFRLLPIISPHSDLQMFGATWDPQNDSVAFYTPYRPSCAPDDCHRVDFFTVEPTDGLGSTSAIVPGEDPHPHIDAVFPDDPVDPNP